MEKKLTIAAIQSISVRGDIARNVERHVVLARAAAERGAALALFPELSLTGYEPNLAHELAMREDDSRLKSLRDLAAESQITIVVGAPLAGDDGAVYIGALCCMPDGDLSVYTKQHLHAGEEQSFVAGSGGPTVNIGGLKTALAICADITHGSHPQHAAANGARLYAAGALISVNGYEADAGLLCGYAKEFGMHVLMANHGGPTGAWQSAGGSALWDATGKKIVSAPPDGECIVIAARLQDGWHGESIAIGG